MNRIGSKPEESVKYRLLFAFFWSGRAHIIWKLEELWNNKLTMRSLSFC